MAVTADKVVVELQATNAAYIADVNKAAAAYDSFVSGAVADATQLEAVTNSAGQALVRTGAQAQVAGAKIRGAGISTANLAAQFNDIAVTLASGQSPFQIALQQGTQITQALGNQGLGATVRALGGAFVSMINPISLATIAIITLGGTAVQYFTQLIGDGETSEETLKKQTDLIKGVADRWGDAVPALKAYVDELERAKNAGDDAAAVDILKRDAFEGVLSQLSLVQPALRDVINELRVTGSAGEQAGTELGQAFFDMTNKVKDGSATTADFDRVLQLVTQLAGDSSSPVFANLSAIVNALAGSFAAAAKAASDVNAQLGALGDVDAGDKARDRLASMAGFEREQERINSLTSDQLALENEISSVKAEYARENNDAVLADTTALAIAKDRLAAEDRRAKIKQGESASLKSANAALKERDAVVDLIEALEFERSILGLSKEDQAVMTALRRAGAAATDEQRAKIEEVVRATQQETAEIANNKQALEDMKSLASDVFSGFINDLREGKSAAEALGGAFDKLADKLIEIAVQNLVGAAFGGIGGGGGFAVGTGIGGNGSGFIPGLTGPRLFANGTRNTGGQRGQPVGIVHGQEAVIPLPDGGKVPVSLAGDAGGDIVFAPQVSMPGADSAAVARMEQALRQLQNEFVPRVREQITTRGRKWQ